MGTGTGWIAGGWGVSSQVPSPGLPLTSAKTQPGISAAWTPGPLKGVPGKSACGLTERTGLFRKHCLSKIVSQALHPYCTTHVNELTAPETVPYNKQDSEMSSGPSPCFYKVLHSWWPGKGPRYPWVLGSSGSSACLHSSFMPCSALYYPSPTPPCHHGRQEQTWA